MQEPIHMIGEPTPGELAAIAAAIDIHERAEVNAPSPELTDGELAAIAEAIDIHERAEANELMPGELAAVAVAIDIHEANHDNARLSAPVTTGLANEDKALEIEVDGRRYARIPVKTHIITDKDKIADVFSTYLRPLAKPGDILFISEKAVACTQARAIPMKDIRPRPLARFLCQFVHKTPYGIGLGIPETMEMALRECGTPRILFAAFISLIGKLMGKRGWFYNIAGDKARAIDGPCDCTIPPYNEYVVLGPADPDRAARIGAEAAGYPVAVVDINDLGGNILGTSDPAMDRAKLVRILADNPLGQSSEQTPCGIIRPVG